MKIKHILLLVVMMSSVVTSYAQSRGFAAGVDATVSLKTNDDQAWQIGVQGEYRSADWHRLYLTSSLNISSYNFRNGFGEKGKLHNTFHSLGIQLTELLGVNLGKGWGIVTGPSGRAITDFDYIHWTAYWSAGVEKTLFSHFTVRLLWLQHLTNVEYDNGWDRIPTYDFIYPKVKQAMNHFQFSILYRF